jgi:carbamate kinase
MRCCAALAAGKHWRFGPDGDRWRRVVPAPEPRSVLEVEPITWLPERRAPVICAGGGTSRHVSVLGSRRPGAGESGQVTGSRKD